MKIKMFVTILILLASALSNQNSVASGNYYQGEPLSHRIKLKQLANEFHLKLPERQLLKAQKTPSKKQFKPLLISQASNINQSFKTLGELRSEKNQSIWRLTINSKTAKHLNLGFSQFHLPSSAILYILDADTGEILKHYSERDNKFHGELWTPIFDTKNIALELNILTTELTGLNLHIQQVSQGVIDFNKAATNTKSGSCNIDVVCPQGDQWRDEIRSVARYTISTSEGTFVCTGSLLNNTSLNLDPLFLTAAHCLVSDTTASSMVFYWNYQTSVCDGTPDGTLLETQTGASYISRWEGINNASDFALVRLDASPEINFNVHYAGWDNRDQTHIGVRSLHHPSGDEKRISIDDDPLTITDISSTTVNAQSHFLRIGAWDEGTTESGSSGAGLWNLNKHIIGTLTGGDASCLAPTTSDWYGRLASHWFGNNFKGNQLAPYLAADNTSTSVLDGLEPCAVPEVTITPSTFSPAIDEQFSISSTVLAGSGGYSYQWDFDGDGQIDSIDANPLHTYDSASYNRVTLVVRDDQQCPGIARIEILVEDPNEVYLKDAQVPTGYAKRPSSVGTWTVSDDQANEGQFSLKSEIVNGNEDSSIVLSGNFNKGSISFDRKVSSEVNFDFFKFYIDDVEKMSISGEQDWSNVSYSFNGGNHSFRWSFEKDVGVSGGQDAAWIDDVSFVEDTTPPPPPPPTPPPVKPSGGGGSMNYILIILLGLLGGRVLRES